MRGAAADGGGSQGTEVEEEEIDATQVEQGDEDEKQGA